ncbi:hypothetical protein F511_06197 [Dorcoceras hygrometricum]|uniref:Myb/SANT-like domain-containing protein n=1 Tax=Dorcoceras hygrometricum TaxID=472368 RepID=A0A2Z7CWF1_9LAMI|nr:hypothetical protein F511_06197 [Dorcoceras hygrometricum]
MEIGETCGSVIGRMKKVDKTRRTWTAPIPCCTLRGNPHINSKVHVWKKTYSTLVTLLGKSGVGWNDTDNTVEATDETWDAIIKTDSIFRTMRHKQWTHYPDWCKIFGNDRATCEHSQSFQNALKDVLNLNDDVHNEAKFGDAFAGNTSHGEDDSISETNKPSSKPKVATTSKKRKRKQVNEVDEAIVAAINNLADITKVTMNDLVKQIAGADNLADAQDVVLDALQGSWMEPEDLVVVSMATRSYIGQAASMFVLLPGIYIPVTACPTYRYY